MLVFEARWSEFIRRYCLSRGRMGKNRAGSTERVVKFGRKAILADGAGCSFFDVPFTFKLRDKFLNKVDL